MDHSFILADYLPYLLNRAGVRIGVAFSREIAPWKITLQMWRVLVALWQSGDQRLGELSERTSIDISTLSRLLLNLQRKRLVGRRRSDLDGRALSLSLTPQGRELTERILPIARHYEEVATCGLSDTEVRRLKRLLIKLYANFATFDVEQSKHKAALADDARSKKQVPLHRRARGRRTTAPGRQTRRDLTIFG